MLSYTYQPMMKIKVKIKEAIGQWEKDVLSLMGFLIVVLILFG